MNKLYTTQLALLALLASSNLKADSAQVAETNEKAPKQRERGLGFDDIFQEMEEHMHKMRAWHTKMFEEFQTMESATSKNVMHTQLPSIKTDIKENENNVFVSIAIGEDAKLALDPKAVDITAQDNELRGTLTLQYGKVDFLVAHNMLQVIKNAEVKEEKKKDDKIESKLVGYSSSSFVQTLPAVVDISQIKAEVNNNILILTIGKKRHAKVPVKLATAA